MKVPFLDLKAQYETIADEIKTGIDEVISKTAFAGGPFVAAFEENFASYCATQHAVGVSSGTSAIWLALAGLGIGPGDEVITAANTFIATAEAISFAGAKPVLVDIEEATYNIDPAKIEAAITPQTKAIIPVHLFGQMADMDPILKIANAHNLFVIEDASQSHGAEYNGQRAGSLGHAGCFSFYPGKNLGAYGEAGGVVTNDEELASRIRMIRDHGQSKKYYHDIIGWNARMDGIQGAVLDVKLRHIENWTEARRANAKRYNELLANNPAIECPGEMDYARHVYHIYAIRTGEREELMSELAARDIHSGIHYPVPIHLQKAYKELGHSEGDFPIAEKCAKEFVSLPMFAELQPEQIEHVANAIEEITQNVPVD